MSNHDVGHAMSLLGEHILELYQAGKFSKETCKSIIRAYIDAAGAYDGNAYEAVESVAEAGYCGLCFGKFDGLWDYYYDNEDLEDFDRSSIFIYFGKTLLHQYVCAECRAKLTREYVTMMKNKKKS